MERAKRVTVILEDGQRFMLHDDAAQLVHFICAMAAELTAAQFYTLWFDASEGDIKPKFEKRWKAVKRRRVA